jgi:1-pyrroline-5-carboxylate dehydrogenase
MSLPRVTYTNLGEDFSGVHARLDAELEQLATQMLGRSHAASIGGQDVAGTETFSIASPIDRDIVLGHFAACDTATVDRAVAAARAGAAEWSALSWQERVARLRRAADLVEERKYPISAACLVEVGKSRMEAVGEVEEAIDLIRYYSGELERNNGYEAEGNKALPQERSWSRLRPYGVFAVIAPFNFPVALSIGMSTAALLGGNAVVFKPNEMSALTGRLLAECFLEAGLPAGAFNLVYGGADVGKALAEHPGVDGIAFTGSNGVGMELLRRYTSGRAAKPVLAEMGGKNSTFVAEDADLDVAAAGVMRSAFGLQGQKCSALSKIYVASAVRFEKAAAEAARDGRLLAGGKRLTEGFMARGLFVEPTLVADLDADHAINREELFLPFLSLQEFTSLDAAIADANRDAYGLTSGVYTQSKATLETFLNTIQAGVLYANRATGATTGAWPGIQTFCGWKGSGTTGKGGLGSWYLPQFMREQSLTVFGQPANA